MYFNLYHYTKRHYVLEDILDCQPYKTYDVAVKNINKYNSSLEYKRTIYINYCDYMNDKVLSQYFPLLKSLNFGHIKYE